jgi:chromosome segregation ATPase
MALANSAAVVDTNATKQSTTATTTGLVTPVKRSGIPRSSSRGTVTPPMQNNNINDNSSSTLGGGSSHSTDHDAQLSRELGRIQSLLGSVLKKRKQQANQQQHHNNSIPLQQQDETEVLHLRAKLEQQEISTSLRKADSSFLQQQLQEKDDLLQEVSNILEQLEARQVQLEQENANLRQQLAEARQAQLEQENAHLRQQLAAAMAAAENKQVPVANEEPADNYEI